MKVEDYQERQLELEGWPVHLTSYRIGEVYHCTADNVSPGGNLARTRGATREEAENKAIQYAAERLSHTHRHTV
jgi:hypothetical protein